MTECKQNDFEGRWWVRTLNGFVVGTSDDFEKACVLAECFQKITGRTAYVYDTY